MTILFVLDLIAVGGYFKKVETQGLTFPGFQTPLSHLICSLLGAKPLSFSDLCSRSKPGSSAKSGREHLTSSHRRPIGRVSGVGADIWEGCLHCTPCARRLSAWESVQGKPCASFTLLFSPPPMPSSLFPTRAPLSFNGSHC